MSISDIETVDKTHTHGDDETPAGITDTIEDMLSVLADVRDARDQEASQ
jgi:hypothetical protein